MQKLCHIDIEGKNGETKIFFSNFPFFFSHLPNNSIFTGWKNSVYLYSIAELDSFIKERNMGFFRLFKVQNKEKLVWTETHTVAKLEYVCNFPSFNF